MPCPQQRPLHRSCAESLGHTFALFWMSHTTFGNVSSTLARTAALGDFRVATANASWTSLAEIRHQMPTTSPCPTAAACRLLMTWGLASVTHSRSLDQTPACLEHTQLSKCRIACTRGCSWILPRVGLVLPRCCAGQLIAAAPLDSKLFKAEEVMGLAGSPLESRALQTCSLRSCPRC